jgi:dGTPase
MQASFTDRAARSATQAPMPPSASSVQRVVADYIAGMTDRFALREHERLFGKRLLNSNV